MNRNFPSFVLLATLAALVSGCAPGETSFTLDRLSRVVDGNGDTIDWEITDSDEVSCVNTEVWHTAQAINAIVVQQNTRQLAVFMDASACDGLPGAFDGDEIAVRWNTSSEGLIGIEINDGESLNVGFGVVDSLDLAWSTASEWGERTVGNGPGGRFFLGPLSAEPLDLERAGEPQLCDCDGLQVRDLTTSGQITKAGDPL